jgi:hypothetical protein
MSQYSWIDMSSIPWQYGRVVFHSDSKFILNFILNLSIYLLHMTPQQGIYCAFLFLFKWINTYGKTTAVVVIGQGWSVWMDSYCTSDVRCTVLKHWHWMQRMYLKMLMTKINERWNDSTAVIRRNNRKYVTVLSLYLFCGLLECIQLLFLYISSPLLLLLLCVHLLL